MGLLISDLIPKGPRPFSVKKIIKIGVSIAKNKKI